MKKLLMYLFLLTALLVILGSCTTRKTPMPTDNIDELLGTWENEMNTKKATGHHFARMIFKPDNTVDLFGEATDDKPGYFITPLEVKEKWKENDVYVYFDTIIHHAGGQGYGLWRVNLKKNTLEMMFSMYDSSTDLTFDISAGFYDIPLIIFGTDRKT